MCDIKEEDEIDINPNEHRISNPKKLLAPKVAKLDSELDAEINYPREYEIKSQGQLKKRSKIDQTNNSPDR